MQTAVSMGNSLPPSQPRLSVTDACPLIPYQRQLVQQTIIHAFQIYVSSYASLPSSQRQTKPSTLQPQHQQLLPIVLIDMIIDYSGFCTEMHIISLDSGRIAGTIGWISTTQLLPRQSTSDRPGWRVIFGALPQQIEMQNVLRVNDYIYVIGYRHNTSNYLAPTEPYRSPQSSGILIRCHVNDLFASAFSNIIPSLDKRELLIKWHELAPIPEDATTIPRHGRMTTSVWKGTRLFVASEHGQGHGKPRQFYEAHYYDTMTNEWHVMEKIDIIGTWHVSVHYNDYLLAHEKNGRVIMYNEVANKWVQSIGRNRDRRYLRLLVSAPSSSVTETPSRSSLKQVIIGTISCSEPIQHRDRYQLVYHIINPLDGTTTAATTTAATNKERSVGSNVASVPTNWMIPNWCTQSHLGTVHSLDNGWLILPREFTKAILSDPDSRSAVVAIAHIHEGEHAWKWHEPFDQVQLTRGLTVYSPMYHC
jgi:hypothetical protein